MVKQRSTRFLEGESVADLVRIVPYINSRTLPSGIVSVNIRAPNDIALPFVRALGRVEARMLRQDAALLERDPMIEPRSNGQRKADALVELVVELGRRTGPAP